MLSTGIPLIFFIMKIRFTLIVGILFLLAGTLLAWPLIDQRLQGKQPTFSQQVSAEPEVRDVPLIQGKPVTIEIPSLGLNLPVIDGYYNTSEKTWTLTSDKAQYATLTPYANNHAGNTFIYGHNRKEVFSSLLRLPAESVAIITTDNGHKFTYKYRSSIETSPYDDSLFDYQGAPILTLQTCSGLWYQNRKLFTFDLVGVS